MDYRYLHLDVFTAEPLAGNQLAVLPEALGLDDSTMQRIANEMAFSETAFVLPAGERGTDHHVRIFTPQRELPMAGHPTVGTAFALAHEGVIPAGTEAVTFQLGVGPTPVALSWNGTALATATMDQGTATFGNAVPGRGPLAAALGLDEGAFHPSLPVQPVSTGLTFLVVPLAEKNAIDSITLDVAALNQFTTGFGEESLPVYVFSLDPPGEDGDAYCRMFGPSVGVMEDPATGSAAGPLAAYLVRHGVAAPGRQLTFVQGVRMGRRSVIDARVEGVDDSGRVHVGGTAVLVAEGVLQV